MKNNLRIGQGYDVHRLVSGRKLMLGGVEIPFEKGLEGHSDADVLLHAIADALLGAMALGDIGKYFPTNDPRFEDVDSMALLKEVYQLCRKQGLDDIINIDTVIMAERPKLAPYIEIMRKNIAGLLDLDIDRVSIKATTTEKLGFTGREEGIAASAVCLINRHE